MGGGGGWCFFFNDTATTEIYTLSLHDALPISDYYISSTRQFVSFGAICSTAQQITSQILVLFTVF